MKTDKEFVQKLIEDWRTDVSTGFMKLYEGQDMTAEGHRLVVAADAMLRTILRYDPTFKEKADDIRDAVQAERARKADPRPQPQVDLGNRAGASFAKLVVLTAGVKGGTWKELQKLIAANGWGEGMTSKEYGKLLITLHGMADEKRVNDPFIRKASDDRTGSPRFFATERLFQEGV